MKTARSRILLAVLSLAAAATVLVSTSRYGAGLSPDSVNYVAAARSFAAGKGLAMYNGSPFVIFPPLYPALLGSISHVTGLDPLSFAHIVNAILFAAIVFLSGVLLSEYVAFSPALAFLGGVAVLVRRPLVCVSVMAWTEPFFIVCVLVFLISARSYVKSASRVSLAAMTLCAAVAPLVRYVGVVIIPVGALLMLFRGGMSLRTRVLHLLGFLVVSLAPWGAWVTRNYLLAGTLMGPRHSSATALFGNLKLALVQVAYEFVGSRHGRLGPVRILTAAALASAAGVACLVFLRRHGILGQQAKDGSRLRSLAPTLLFTVLYVSIIVVSSTTTAYDQIDSRLMSPVYVPLIVLLFALLDRFIDLARTVPLGRHAQTTMLAVVAIWLVSPAAEVCTGSPGRSRKGAGGYNTVAWRESPTMDFVKHLPGGMESTIYTNASDAIYILAHRAAKTSPSKTHYRSSEVANNITDLAQSWPEGDKGLLVWFEHKGRTYLYTPTELSSIADLDTLAGFEDGVVYRVSAKEQ
jgi:hypothetical protein